MAASGSVTHWIQALRGGDPDAAQKLWERYFPRLVGLARKRLQGARRRVEDEEDVALSAFKSFWRGARQGRFPQLADRNDLAGVAGEEVMKGVVAGNSGDAGDEQRKWRWFVGAGDHAAILTESRRVSQWELTCGAAAGDKGGIVGGSINAGGGMIDDRD